MKLQTHIKLPPSSTQFGYEDKLLLLGSCFAENIGAKLAYHKFQVVTNPFGITFNPVALEQLVQDAIANKTHIEEDVFEHQKVWKSFAAHSSLNASSRLEAVIRLQEAQQELRTYITEVSHIFITLGTAWVYRHMQLDKVVANCHKVSQKEFQKELLSEEEVHKSISQTCQHIKSLNPQAHIVFTVSPVRHAKDGFVENTRSKAHLITAIHKLVDTKQAFYFPAYELMMDELRDYRFYASDMLHPSEQAISYVWERFIEVYAFAKAKQTLTTVASIQKRKNHKPFNPESEEHNTFVKNVALDIAKLKETHPLINF